MSDETTSPTPPAPSATEYEKASADLAAARAELQQDTGDVGSPRRRALVERIEKHTKVVHAYDAAQHPVPALAQRRAELEARLAARGKIRVNRDALQAMAETDPDRELLIEEQIHLAPQAARPASTPGSFTPADSDRVLHQDGIGETERTQFKLGFERLGVSPLAAFQVATALRDATPNPHLSAEEREALWSSWWGDEAYDANFAAVQRVWNQLQEGERQLLLPYRGARAFVERVLAVGKGMK